jgi:hypothetical protein
MTVHKAQGLTTAVALLYGASALCQQAGYVAMSRGREANHLYANLGSLQPGRAPAGLGCDDGVLASNSAEVVRALAGYFGHDRRQVLALDQQPSTSRPTLPTREPENWPFQWFEPNRDTGLGRSR